MARETFKSTRKKILIIAGFDKSLINFRGPLLRRMVEMGYDVCAAAPNLSAGVAEELEKMNVRPLNVKLSRVGLNPILDLLSLWDLYRLIRRENPSVILSYTIKPVIYGGIAGRLARVRSRFALITGLGYAFARTSLKQRLIGMLAKPLYRLALGGGKQVFFFNPEDMATFRSANIVTSEQAVLTIGTGVDLSHYKPNRKDARVVFLMMARLIVAKGVRDYVEAVRNVKSNHDHCRFLLAGVIEDGPDAISMEEIQSWQEEGAIEYLGCLDDVRPALAEASVYVLPTFYPEGTPRSILEALASRLPIITTDTPGCRQTVMEGENGFLVPPQDVARLTQAMSTFAQDPSLIEKMGEKSLKMAQEKFDVRLANAHLLEKMGLDD